MTGDTLPWYEALESWHESQRYTSKSCPHGLKPVLRNIVFFSESWGTYLRKNAYG